MNSLLRRLLSAPTLHFFLLGALAWAIHARYAGEPPVLVIDAQRIAQMASEWEARQRRPLADEQHQVIYDQVVREAVLVEFARAAGLEQSDVVRDRLIKLGHFLDLVDPQADAVETARAARELDLHRSDPVVRRYLANVAELLLARSAEDGAIDDQAIADYYAAHGDEFLERAVIRLSHAFVAGAGDESRRRAGAILETARDRRLNESAAIALGDVFYGGHVLENTTSLRLAGLFGDGFAEALQMLPEGQWSGPVPSAYGWHVVVKETLVPERLPPLARVRDKIENTLRRERERTAVDSRVNALRYGYRIVVSGQS